jgi:hypothetical protein
MHKNEGRINETYNMPNASAIWGVKTEYERLKHTKYITSW